MDNEDLWSKQNLIVKFSNSFDENGGPLSEMTVLGTPYSLNTCFKVTTVALAVVLHTFLMTGNLL